MGEREEAAAQEALQLKRRNFELHVVGVIRQRLAQALSAEAEYNMHEPAREHDLAELVDWHTHVLAEVTVEEWNTKGWVHSRIGDGFGILLRSRALALALRFMFTII